MKHRSTKAVVIPIRDASSCQEPTLEEILSDPITRAVMRADGVDQHQFGAMLRRVAAARRVFAKAG